jgi:hypothetical protein
MLIGRHFLDDKFLVDVSKEYLSKQIQGIKWEYIYYQEMKHCIQLQD